MQRGLNRLSDLADPEAHQPQASQEARLSESGVWLSEVSFLWTTGIYGAFLGDERDSH